jgi:hypothetical protein
MSEPILTKRISHPYDYKPMTWEIFIKLRKTAQEVANNIGYPVYLVGSVLEKAVPRDIDVSVIMPIEEYEKRYGKFTDDKAEQGKVMANAFNKNVKHYFKLEDALEPKTYLDFKVCADTWFTDKPKLLIAEPKKE